MEHRQARSTWRRFAGDQRGVTAIEFAVLAIPFFTIIAAILETALVFLAGQILDSAVYDASRTIRTGRAASFDKAAFRQSVCANLYGMFDCTSDPEDPQNDRLRINVTVIDDFTSAPTDYPLVTGENCTALSCDWVMEDSYGSSVGGNVVLVQAYYKWPTLVRLPGFDFQTLPDGSRLIGAARVFMNEPF